MKLLHLLALAAVVSATSHAPAAFAGDGVAKIKVTLKPAGSFVAESADLKVRGKVTRSGNQVTAEDIILDLDTLKTGIPLRDKHMKEKYLETGKPEFRYAQLMRAQGSGGKLVGELKIHGVTQKFEGTYELSGGKFNGTFPLTIPGFKIEAPRYMGVGVKDEVQVEISIPESLAGRSPASVPSNTKANPRRR